MIANVCVERTHRLTIHPATNSRKDIIGAVSKALNLSPADFYLMQNGKLLSNDMVDMTVSPIHVCMRLFGGKGGFGSMLRAIGAQIEKTTNREACRDLSGRRLRDINEEKKVKEYLEKQANQDDDESAKIARKIERLRSKPKHEFKDEQYFEARSNLLDDVSDALEEGFKNATTTSTATTSAVSSGSGSMDANSIEAGSSGVKRKTTNAGKKQKKKLKGAQWLDEGLSSDDSDDESSDESSDDSCEKSKPSKQTTENKE